MKATIQLDETITRHLAEKPSSTMDWLKQLRLPDTPYNYYAANQYGVALSEIRQLLKVIEQLRSL